MESYTIGFEKHFKTSLLHPGKFTPKFFTKQLQAFKVWFSDSLQSCCLFISTTDSPFFFQYTTLLFIFSRNAFLILSNVPLFDFLKQLGTYYQKEQPERVHWSGNTLLFLEMKISEIKFSSFNVWPILYPFVRNL